MNSSLGKTLTLPSLQRGLSVYLMIHTNSSRGFSATVIHDKSGANLAFICASERDCDRPHLQDAFGGCWELWMRGGHVCLPALSAAKAAQFLGIAFPASGEAS